MKISESACNYLYSNPYIFKDVFLPLTRTATYLGASYLIANKIYHGACYTSYKIASWVKENRNELFIKKAEEHKNNFYNRLGFNTTLTIALITLGLIIETFESDLNLYIQAKENEESFLAKISRGEFSKAFGDIEIPINKNGRITLTDSILKTADRIIQEFRITKLATNSYFKTVSQRLSYLLEIPHNVWHGVNKKDTCKHFPYKTKYLTLAKFISASYNASYDVALLAYEYLKGQLNDSSISPPNFYQTKEWFSETFKHCASNLTNHFNEQLNKTTLVKIYYLFSKNQTNKVNICHFNT